MVIYGFKFSYKITRKVLINILVRTEKRLKFIGNKVK